VSTTQRGTLASLFSDARFSCRQTNSVNLNTQQTSFFLITNKNIKLNYTRCAASLKL